MSVFPRAARGYRRDQVDAFVARIEGTLGRRPLYAAPVTAVEIEDVKFGTTLRGYRTQPVDDALDGYVREMETHGVRSRLPSGDSDRLIGMVRNVMFARTRFTEGYDEDHVDAFLDKMIGLLGGHRALASDVRAARFGTTRMRAGYSQAEVDGFLAHLGAEIERARQR
jgi:DivIVA domain-containing protein